MTRAATTLLRALLLSACAGTKARENVLVPAMQVAWPRIEAVAMLAATEAEAPVIARFGAAVVSGDPMRIAALPFEPVRVLALQGIAARLADGTLGQFGAASYRESVRLFNESWLKLREGL